MRATALPVALMCLISFHSSDGSLIWIRTAAITVIKPISAEHLDHLAKGTHAVVYTITGRTFAVRETDEAIVRMYNSCSQYRC
jgi:hypothetical protein